MNEDLGVGDVVWAKTRGEPWWPAVILNIDGSSRGAEVTVSFIGESTNARVVEKRVARFGEDDQKPRGASRSSAFHAALERADKLAAERREKPLAHKPPTYTIVSANNDALVLDKVEIYIHPRSVAEISALRKAKRARLHPTNVAPAAQESLLEPETKRLNSTEPEPHKPNEGREETAVLQEQEPMQDSTSCQQIEPELSKNVDKEEMVDVEEEMDYSSLAEMLGQGVEAMLKNVAALRNAFRRLCEYDPPLECIKEQGLGKRLKAFTELARSQPEFQEFADLSSALYDRLKKHVLKEYFEVSRKRSPPAQSADLSSSSTLLATQDLKANGNGGTEAGTSRDSGWLQAFSRTSNPSHVEVAKSTQKAAKDKRSGLTDTKGVVKENGTGIAMEDAKTEKPTAEPKQNGHTTLAHAQRSEQNGHKLVMETIKANGKRLDNALRKEESIPPSTNRSIKQSGTQKGKVEPAIASRSTKATVEDRKRRPEAKSSQDDAGSSKKGDSAKDEELNGKKQKVGDKQKAGNDQDSRSAANGKWLEKASDKRAHKLAQDSDEEIDST